MRIAWTLMLVLAATTVGAQEAAVAPSAAPKRNVVSLDLLSLAWSGLEVGGERVLSDRVSVGVGLGVTLNVTGSSFESEAYPEGVAPRNGSRALGLRLQPQARFFLHGRAPVGFWVGPEVGVHFFDQRHFSKPPLPESESKARFVTLHGAALAGYSVQLSSRVMLQASAGLRASRSRGESGFTPAPERVERSVRYEWDLRPVTHLSLGYAF